LLFLAAALLCASSRHPGWRRSRCAAGNQHSLEDQVHAAICIGVDVHHGRPESQATCVTADLRHGRPASRPTCLPFKHGDRTSVASPRRDTLQRHPFQRHDCERRLRAGCDPALPRPLARPKKNVGTSAAIRHQDSNVLIEWRRVCSFPHPEFLLGASVLIHPHKRFRRRFVAVVHAGFVFPTRTPPRRCAMVPAGCVTRARAPRLGSVSRPDQP
jgi:hypothetical protein